MLKDGKCPKQERNGMDARRTPELEDFFFN